MLAPSRAGSKEYLFPANDLQEPNPYKPLQQIATWQQSMVSITTMPIRPQNSKRCLLVTLTKPRQVNPKTPSIHNCPQTLRQENLYKACTNILGVKHHLSSFALHHYIGLTHIHEMEYGPPTQAKYAPVGHGAVALALLHLGVWIPPWSTTYDIPIV